MRAVMFRGPDKPIALETVPDPTPGPGELILKVGRCGICGSDVRLTEQHGWYLIDTALGHEYAGEVVAMGAGVDDYKIGDIVTGMPSAGCGQCRPCVEGLPLFCKHPEKMINCTGAFAEYVRTVGRTSVKLPSSLSMADGALVEPLAVGLHGVALAKMPPGARVLVTGAGGIGLAAAYWARKLGAGKMAVIARSRKKEQEALHIGADAFILTGENEVEEVKAALGGQPDVVFECIGVQGGLAQAINHVRTDGTVISLGFCTKPDPVLPALATWKQVHLIFSMAYSLGEFQATADMLDRGHLEPRAWVGDPIPLVAVPDKIMSMRANGSTEVKVQVDPWL